MDSENIEWLTDKAKALADACMLDEAVVLYDKMLEMEPDNYQVWLDKALALHKLDDAKEEIKCWDEVLRTSEHLDMLVRATKALALHKLGRSEEGLGLLDVVMMEGNKKDKIYALPKKAFVLYEMGRAEESLGCLDELLQLDPDSQLAYFNKGVIFADRYDINRERGSLQKAIECYDRVIKINPDTTDAAQSIYNKGMALVRIRRSDEALLCFDKAIQLMPDFAGAYSEKGKCLDALDRYEEAIWCFDQALHLDPGDGPTFYHKSRSLYLLDRIEEALQLLDFAVKLDPLLPDHKELREMLTDRLEFRKNL